MLASVYILMSRLFLLFGSGILLYAALSYLHIDLGLHPVVSFLMEWRFCSLVMSVDFTSDFQSSL